jgi:hypothetical protein
METFILFACLRIVSSIVPGLQICAFTLLIQNNHMLSACFQEREKLILTRMVVFELVQVLKFKTSIPDSNFLMLINFILQVINIVLMFVLNQYRFQNEVTHDSGLT